MALLIPAESNHASITADQSTQNSSSTMVITITSAAGLNTYARLASKCKTAPLLFCSHISPALVSPAAKPTRLQGDVTSTGDERTSGGEEQRSDC
jgi:hypothetical protein